MFISSSSRTPYVLVLSWFDVQFRPEMVDVLYDCAKFRYECGNYTEASENLYFYKVLVSFYCVFRRVAFLI